MFSHLPKTFLLPSDKEATIRLLEKRDEKKLLDFFKRLPPEDRLFLKDDVTDPRVINRWVTHLDFKRVIPFVVECEDLIIADGTLHRSEYGWMRHIGEIRLVVDKKFRGQTVGLHLVREIYFAAMNQKLEKLVAEMMESQHNAIRIFKKLGFKQEATLKNHVMDLTGAKHNLIILSHSVTAHWNEMENLIADFHGDFSGDFAGGS